LLDGLSVIAQYAPDGQRQAWYTQSLARIDEVLNVANDSGKFWYQADALGSVYGLTNQAGALIGSQGYDVFGAPTPAPSGPAGQPFGFTGREHELDSGLVYARDRYLAPGVGTWTQADRLNRALLVGVSLPTVQHAYHYANQQPTRLTDPTGQVAPVAVLAILIFLALAVGHDDAGGMEYDETMRAIDVATLAGSARGAALLLGEEGACSLSVVRAQYVSRVRNMERIVTEMRASGASSEQIAPRRPAPQRDQDLGPRAG
jgi:RHS repeat-associated protein